MSTPHTRAYTVSPPSDTFVTLARAGSSPDRGSSYGRGRYAVWFFRALLLVPFALMAPEVTSAIMGKPDGVANISASVADVLGTSTFLIFIMMLAVTPIYTTTGWRWHVILRRDFGIASRKRSLNSFAAAVKRGSDGGIIRATPSTMTTSIPSSVLSAAKCDARWRV